MDPLLLTSAMGNSWAMRLPLTHSFSLDQLAWALKEAVILVEGPTPEFFLRM